MARNAHTFLFIDLVGFTALADAEGDGRALEVVLELQCRVRTLLAQHNAEEVKALGDGVMLHSTDARSAIGLGVRLVDELGQLPGFPPVRVGIHTGPALASDGDWFGRTVNVASRLCSVAAGGDVLVSETTRNAAGRISGLGFGGRELHWLRNVSEPIGAYPVSADAIRARRAVRVGLLSRPNPRGAIEGAFA